MQLVPETSPLPRLLTMAVLPLAMCAATIVHLNVDLVYSLAHCPLRDITGVPCLTCGATAAFVALSHGRLLDAFHANALTVLVTCGLLACVPGAIVSTMVPRWRYSLSLTPREKKAARIGAALFLILAWVWQFRPGVYFTY